MSLYVGVSKKISFACLCVCDRDSEQTLESILTKFGTQVLGFWTQNLGQVL